MTEQVGASIKEARLAANMTQKQLAEAAGNISARDISNVERGLKEPTDEQLAAIAKAIGVDPKSLLGDAEGEAPEAQNEAEAPASQEEAAPAAKDEDILELFNAADPAVKKAALSVLKGETPEKKNILETILPAITGILGGMEMDGNPIAAIVGFLSSKEGEAFLETIKGVLGNITSVFAKDGAADDEGKSARETSNSFLAFTFFYTVAIYVLLIGFHYIQAQKDIKLEK